MSILFDISNAGIPILFENSKLLKTDESYRINVFRSDLYFTTKSCGELDTVDGYKLLVSGSYEGTLNYMNN